MKYTREELEQDLQETTQAWEECRQTAVTKDEYKIVAVIDCILHDLKDILAHC